MDWIGLGWLSWGGLGWIEYWIGLLDWPVLCGWWWDGGVVDVQFGVLMESDLDFTHLHTGWVIGSYHNAYLESGR